ncbi:MAG: MBOAT family O-acyltransferase [Olsenella sp.]|jgi:alginate O-acetyltransferase complex protein AlgI
MQIISLAFVLFVLALLCLYYLVGRFFGRYQWVVILVANFVFYYLAASLSGMVFILTAALPTWLASQAFGKLTASYKARRKATKDKGERKRLKAQLKRRKRVVLVAALAVILGVLGYLKYWNVILFNFDLAPSPSSLGILLPMGISFYTFMSAMYLIDTYNDKYAPERNFLRYLAFVSYFPCFIQGPINRYDEMSPQLAEVHHIELRKIQRGLLRLGLGLLKKCAIASMLTANVSAILAAIGPDTPGAAIVVGVVLYSFFMYGDFSGGIDMVEGVSELFGIEMSENFRQPYLSVSIADFWRRWHKSLGVFMRDYLFYPIALTKPMQRFSKWAQAHTPHHIGRTLPACIANIIVFFFVGLWHGAEWHYIAWGMYNGVVVALADLFEPVFHSMKARLHVRDDSKPYYAFTVVRTFVMVNIGRYFDCIASVSISLLALHNTFFKFAPTAPLTTVLADMGVSHAATLGVSWVAFAAMLVVAVIDVAEEKGVDVRDKILSWKFYQRVLLYVVVGLIFAASLPTTVTAGVTFAYANF